MTSLLVEPKKASMKYIVHIYMYVRVPVARIDGHTHMYWYIQDTQDYKTQRKTQHKTQCNKHIMYEYGR